MERPPQDAIETFMSITGASEALTLQKLEEHGGDLNDAINAHFNGDRNTTHVASDPDDDLMDVDDPLGVISSRPAIPVMSNARSLDSVSLLDPNFGGNVPASGFSRGAPRVSQPREVREIPTDFKGGSTQPGSSGGTVIEDITGFVPPHGQEVHGAVIIDGDDDEDLQSAPDNKANGSDDFSYVRLPTPSITPFADVADYNNDIEEEMIKAAIEASKREAEGYPGQQLVVPNGSTSQRLDRNSPALEDAELAHAVSISLKTAELEKARREKGVDNGEQSSSSFRTNLAEDENKTSENERPEVETSNQLKPEGNTYVQVEAEDVDEKPLMRHRSKRVPAASPASRHMVGIPPSSLQQDDSGTLQVNGDAFPTDEWGGMSSQEHDEAVMLEAAMFGGIPEENTYPFAYPRPGLQASFDGNSNLYHGMPQPPSPTLTTQRLLRVQQDDEYLASLQADREKELKAKQDTEAALEREKLQDEEIRRRLLEEEEFERKLAAREASLPLEPPVDDENVVTLLVRMPDGSRRGRRFLKSDKLQLLFDYIDIGRVVNPGTYRLVRSYPRRPFTDGESELSLSNLGLTTKQEALFLELI